MEDTRVPRENHRPAASLGKTFSHNVILSTSRLSRVRTHNISGDNPNNYSFRVKLLHKCTNKIEKAVLIYLIISNLDIFFLWCHQWILSDIINELTLILKMICQCNVKYIMIIICTEFLSMMFLSNKNHKNWYSKNNKSLCSMRWVESFCWYWWHCWTPLFKLSF